MKKSKIIIALILSFVVIMMFGCGDNSDPTATNNPTTNPSGTSAPTQEPTQEPSFNGYTVRVVDENGKGIPGCIVQLCKDSCIPSQTDADGIAKYNVPEDEYKVTFVTLPDGYTYSGDEQTFYFESGSKEMTITLNAQ